jgi:hypothetical protein
MAESETAHAAPRTVASRASSVLLVIATGVLIGAGIFGTVYWLYTSFAWIWFPSLVAVVVGCYLLFTRVSGPDRA